MSISIAKLRTALEACFEAKVPALVLGPPGSGKTQMQFQLAETLGYDHVYVSGPRSDVLDSRGMPAIVEGKGAFLPFGIQRRILESTKPLLVIIDDVAHAPRTVRNALLHEINERCVNDQPVPDGVRFALLANRRGDKADAEALGTAMLSRCAVFDYEPTFTDWRELAFSKGYRQEVIGFLSFRTELFMADNKLLTAAYAAGENFPCPRTWENVSKLLNTGAPRSVYPALVAASVGPGAGYEFVAYMDTVAKVPDLDELLRDPHKAPLFGDDPSMCYAVLTALVYHTKKAKMDALAEYLGRYSPEWSAYTLRALSAKYSTIPVSAGLSKLAVTVLNTVQGVS